MFFDEGWSYGKTFSPLYFFGDVLCCAHHILCAIVCEKDGERETCVMLRGLHSVLNRGLGFGGEVRSPLSQYSDFHLMFVNLGVVFGFQESVSDDLFKKRSFCPIPFTQVCG